MGRALPNRVVTTNPVRSSLLRRSQDTEREAAKSRAVQKVEGGAEVEVAIVVTSSSEGTTWQTELLQIAALSKLSNTGK